VTHFLTPVRLVGSIAAAAVVAVTATGCARTTSQSMRSTAPAGQAPNSSPISKPAGTGTSAQLAAQAAGEMLYPGDIVRLRIYREPDLSGDYEVNAEGMAVFPKIGSVHVNQITTDSLQRLLVTTYAQYLRDPAIEVTPLRRVTVLGAVKNPGVYPVDPTMSIADAVALAGGPSADGNQKKVQLIRGGKKENVTITAHQQIAQTPIRSGDELYVPERSWIARNGYIVGAAIGAATIITTTIITHY